jgi:putative tryptophan/tyrosine transport system substrate-binding protein
MKRREFITLVGGAAVASPFGARGQQAERRRIGVLLSTSETDPEGQTQAAALRQGLQELGWTEGRNIQIDYRWSAGDPGRGRGLCGRARGIEARSDLCCS